MALKDMWTDKVDGVDDVLAEDINNIAKGVIDIETAMERGEFKGEKGDKGDKGDPYTLTESDKQSIVADVLAALPNGDEVAY